MTQEGFAEGEGFTKPPCQGAAETQVTAARFGAAQAGDSQDRKPVRLYLPHLSIFRLVTAGRLLCVS